MGKRIKVWVIVLLFTVLISSAVQAQAAELGTRSLKAGTSGEDVKQLQQLLKSIGYFQGTATGYYGNVTRASVLSFQKAYGLSIDGVAGPNTIFKLKYENGIADRSFVYIRLLKRGLSGADVKNLQVVLVRLGFMSPQTSITGFFGSQTESSVKSFQRQWGLTVDGIVGPSTASNLNKALAAANSSTPGSPITETQIYTVQPGDSLWVISQKFKVTVADIQKANGLTGTTIYAGQKLYLPTGSTAPPDRGDQGRPGSTVTYATYIVKAGDSIWSIANSHGLQPEEVLKANNMSSSSVIYAGQALKIPVYNIPVKPTPAPWYGEYLDWWTEAQYVVPLNSVFTVTDFLTGVSFTAKRTFGYSHADCEPLTAQDTAVMRNLWNQYHTSYWTARAVIITIGGRKIAASASAMFHAGLDAYPNGAYVNNRSGGYGYGMNYDAVKGNNADGHFDIHFLNSTRHSDGQISGHHQEKIKLAAGVK